ncbi:MAG: WYL domain-containing protein [Bacteroidales bacterium]|nr:WYL domain-containing protein [Bacteroidales bacterium]
MSLQGTIKRYSLIIDKVRNSNFPSFKEIHEMLQDEGFQISSRTLQRDMEDIRDEFGIELTYDSSKNGYFIDYEKSINADYILHFLELGVSSQLLIDSLKKGKEILKYISFDSYEGFKGLNNIQKLLSAIKNHKKITFKHTSYQTGKTCRQNVRPYLLKEFQGRWYLYAENPSIKKFRIYGLDRIDDLRVLDKTFIPSEDVDCAARFADMIGISNAFKGQEKQEIILSFYAEQGKYFKSLPWHLPYKVIEDNDHEFRISMIIIPNYELLQRILMHNGRIEVIKPEWLREEVKDALAEALKKYS